MMSGGETGRTWLSLALSVVTHRTRSRVSHWAPITRSGLCTLFSHPCDHSEDLLSCQNPKFLGQKITPKVWMWPDTACSVSQAQGNELILERGGSGGVSNSAASIQRAPTVKKQGYPDTSLDGIYFF